MADKIKKQDFVEVDYTGKLEDNTVFDTTDKKTAQDAGLPTEKAKFGPMIICVGERQLLPGLDDTLVDKEINKEYEVNLSPENAFGKRDVKKMKIVPMSMFKEHKVQPHPGLQIDVDGKMGTITRVAGGRIIVNFNHPLAGKTVVYTVKINRIITDQKEKIASFLNTAMKIGEDNIKTEINEDKAEVTLPMLLPEQFTDAIGKKLAELVGLKEVNFKSKEVKKE
jgi:FKBP-type peptidyl-prolyl cis-trans isomerase SlyD